MYCDTIRQQCLAGQNLPRSLHTLLWSLHEQQSAPARVTDRPLALNLSAQYLAAAFCCSMDNTDSPRWESCGPLAVRCKASCRQNVYQNVGSQTLMPRLCTTMAVVPLVCILSRWDHSSKSRSTAWCLPTASADCKSSTPLPAGPLSKGVALPHRFISQPGSH